MARSRKSQDGSRARSRRARWLVLPLGLALAAAALWGLASSEGAPTPRVRESRNPPLDDIDDASRARLERVLRDAEGQRR